MSLYLDKGERVCLLGRNGTGKSTLLKLISGTIRPDSGMPRIGAGVQISHLAQDILVATSGTVFDEVAAELGASTALVREYHDLGQRLGDGTDPGLLARLEAIQHRLEASGG